MVLAGSFPISSNIEMYFYRNFGALMPADLFDIPNDTYIVNAHIEQSLFAQQTARYELDFWGKGYGSELDQFTYKDYRGGIHNSFVQVWMKHGLIAYLYYVFLAVLLLFELIRTIKNVWKWDKEFILLRSCVIIYLIFLISALWMIGLPLLVEAKMVVFRILLLLSLFKITPQNYKLLFTKGKKYRVVIS